MEYEGQTPRLVVVTAPDQAVRHRCVPDRCDREAEIRVEQVSVPPAIVGDLDDGFVREPISEGAALTQASREE
jgi:hypothetical protein